MKRKYFLADRVKRLREQLGLTQSKVADAVSISESVYRGWESGSVNILQKHGKNLCRILKTTEAYLLGDTNDPTDSYELQQEPTTITLSSVVPNGLMLKLPKPPRRIPVVSWARAGLATDYGDLCNQIDEEVLSDCDDPNAFALIIEGDSMEPVFKAGLRVVFAPNSEPRNGDFVVARLKVNNGVMFKKFKRTGPEGATIRLESLNPDYSPLEFPIGSFRFIYPAVEYHGKISR